MKQVSVCAPSAAPGECEQQQTENSSDITTDSERTLRMANRVFRPVLVEALPDC